MRPRKHLIWSLCLVGLFVCVPVHSQQNPINQTNEYRDTEFGEHLYSEASVDTRLELLGLLSKDTPSIMVFMHAISMGLGIDDMLEASVRYEPDRARDFSESAISLLPLLTDRQDYTYSQYDLDDLERESGTEPYVVAEVIARFFDNREILGPQPDWMEGQYHFNAPAGQLKELLDSGVNDQWYFERENLISTNQTRPIFISLYDADQSILIDGAARIRQMPISATFPVVFIFNREQERSMDSLVERSEYPRTIEGVQEAYSENLLMVTPVPEWQHGDYHLQAEIKEIDELFELPEEDDFESPEHWQALLQQALEYETSQPAFLVVVLSGDDSSLTQSYLPADIQYAAYANPREEEPFPFVFPNNNNDEGDDEASHSSNGLSLRTIMSKGLIINRPDLLAAIKSIGNLDTVPVAFYYIDNARTKPYTFGPRALRLFVSGIPTSGIRGGGGGFGPPPPPPEVPSDDGGPPPPPEVPIDDDFGPPPDCASPPCS